MAIPTPTRSFFASGPTASLQARVRDVASAISAGAKGLSNAHQPPWRFRAAFVLRCRSHFSPEIPAPFPRRSRRVPLVFGHEIQGWRGDLRRGFRARLRRRGVFALYTLAGQLNGWWQARSWQAVPATVVSAELKTSHGRRESTYRALARYRYVVNGHTYEGDRINLGGASNNGWQEGQYTRLKDARDNQRSIEVWVDPR